MHSDKRIESGQKSRSNRMILTVIGTVVAAAIIVFCVAKNRGANNVFTVEVPSIEVQTAFWNEHFVDFFKTLAAESFPYPEINQRLARLRGMIIEKYHRKLNINLSPNLINGNPAIDACSWVKDGEPIVAISIPKIMNKYREFRSLEDSEWRERLRNTVLVSLIHEMDHLAHGYILSLQKDDSYDALVEDEVRAWAMTCEYTIRPLVEIHHAPLNKSKLFFYEQWVACDRNVDNPAWREGMRNALVGARR